MSGAETAALAAAVSNAGGFGMTGGTRRGGADWLRVEIRAARDKNAVDHPKLELAPVDVAARLRKFLTGKRIRDWI